MVKVSEMVRFVLVVLYSCNVAFGAVYILRLPEKPEEFKHMEGCYIEELNSVIGYGSNISPLGICRRIECLNNSIRYYTCGTVGTEDSKCYVTDEDLRFPYPDCCPQVKCDTNTLL